MKKLFIRIVIVLVALLVVGFLCRNFIARKAVEIVAKDITGFPLEIGAVDIGLFSGTLEVRDLKMMNPPEFHGGTFVSLPLLKVDYKTLSFLCLSPHIKELVVNVAEVDLVTNEKGDTNATVLQNKVAASGGTNQTASASGSSTPKDKKKMSYRVDLVHVHVGTVIKRSFNSAGKPSETKLTFNLDKIYTDINESTSITKLIMDTVFGQLGAVAGEMIKGTGAAVNNAGQTLQKTGKGLFDNLKKVVPQQ